MKVTKPEDHIQIHVGYHIALVEKEINSKNPDCIVLTNCFFAIVDALHSIVRQYSPLSTHADNWQCYTSFLFEHFNDRHPLEEYVNRFITTDITVNQTSCRITHTHQKYSLLHKALTRRDSDGLTCVECLGCDEHF